MSHRLQITLDDNLYDALQAEAHGTGASLAELVRRSAMGSGYRPPATDSRCSRVRRVRGLTPKAQVSTSSDTETAARRSSSAMTGNDVALANIVTALMSQPRRVVVDTNVVVYVLRGNDRARVSSGADRGLRRLVHVGSHPLRAWRRARPNEAASSPNTARCTSTSRSMRWLRTAAALARAYRRSHSAIDPTDYLIAATTEMQADAPPHSI